MATATRSHGSAADNPLSPLRCPRTPGTAANPLVISSSPPRIPGSAANPLVVNSSPPNQRRGVVGTSSAMRTVASTRSARVAAASTPTPLRINSGTPSTIPRRGRLTTGVRVQPYPPGLLGNTRTRDAATREHNRARIDAESAAFRAAHPLVPHVQLPRIRTRRPKVPDDSARTEHEDPSPWSPCPECRTVMNDTPCRNYSEEAGIILDHPEWHDRSRVDYSWEGLRFPKVRILSDDEW
ncbi:hypothetical protein B0H11DRAFT_1914574 [Mycena galericulata]|nr:hypothetical protein B0H11DRAFT_1914574 [Mycena galericulata]